MDLPVHLPWGVDLNAVPHDLKLEKGDYEERLKSLQQDMLELQTAYILQQRRAILVFEGWDAAGKGGVIKRMTYKLDPRAYRVWPIAAPDEHERKRHYLYRFWKRLPANGEIAIFDRSWYGRVLVERVDGLTEEADWKRAYDEINAFEKTLIDNGSRIIKFFHHISPEVQAKRFKDRIETPYKRWKITMDDFRARERWADYEGAVQDMLNKTSTTIAPWHVIPAHDKKFARILVMTLAANALEDAVDRYDLKLAPGVREAARTLGLSGEG